MARSRQPDKSKFLSLIGTAIIGLSSVGDARAAESVVFDNINGCDNLTLQVEGEDVQVNEMFSLPENDEGVIETFACPNTTIVSDVEVSEDVVGNEEKFFDAFVYTDTQGNFSEVTVSLPLDEVFERDGKYFLTSDALLGGNLFNFTGSEGFKLGSTFHAFLKGNYSEAIKSYIESQGGRVSVSLDVILNGGFFDLEGSFIKSTNGIRVVGYNPTLVGDGEFEHGEMIEGPLYWTDSSESCSDELITHNIYANNGGVTLVRGDDSQANSLDTLYSECSDITTCAGGDGETYFVGDVKQSYERREVPYGELCRLIDSYCQDTGGFSPSVGYDSCSH